MKPSFKIASAWRLIACLTALAGPATYATTPSPSPTTGAILQSGAYSSSFDFSPVPWTSNFNEQLSSGLSATPYSPGGNVPGTRYNVALTQTMVPGGPILRRQASSQFEFMNPTPYEGGELSCGRVKFESQKYFQRTCFFRAPASPPIDTLQNRYRYLISGAGQSIAGKDTQCRALGANWRLATLDTPAEIHLMREYLQRFAPRPSSPRLRDLPAISNSCASVDGLPFTGIVDGVDCSGANVIVNWPDVFDDCEAGQGPGPCAFMDIGVNIDNYPALCEDSSVVVVR